MTLLEDKPTATTPGATATPPPVRREEERLHELRVMKRRATGLLIVMSVVFLVLALTTSDEGWGGYARAAAEASMVGGLADWFAVTALFRHPMGIPIPHTAVIRERKDQFGQTLGEFVQQNFLSSQVISERVRGSRVVVRAADWLANEDNARTVARHAADLVVEAAEVVRDEDVNQLLHEEVARAVESLPLAPMAGRAVRMATADDRHHDLFDAILRGLERFLDENREPFRERFVQESPWWLPGALEDRIFDRLFDGVGTLLRDVNSNPDHDVRRQFDEWVVSFAERLENSPELNERAEELKRDLLAHPELRTWSSSLWTELKASLRAQAADPDSELRVRIASAVTAAGRRLRDDPALLAKAEELVESGVKYVAEHFHDEITDLVSGTIARWDADETSRKLELLLGRDLQFIRINGTVVGGLAGVAIHGIGHALG